MDSKGTQHDEPFIDETNINEMLRDKAYDIKGYNLEWF